MKREYFFILSLAFLIVLLTGITGYYHSQARMGIAIITGGHTAAAAGWNSGLSTDANLVARWKLDDGALVTDTSGDNDWTTNTTVTADTSDKKEGDASGFWEDSNNDYMEQTDAELDADFPLKNGVSGDWSVSFWVYPTQDVANGDYNYILYKNTSSPNRSLFIALYGDSGAEYIRVAISTTGEDFTGTNHGSDLALEDPDYWIYVTVTWNETDDDLKVRIYNASCTQIGSELTVDLAANMNRNSVNLTMGGDTGGGNSLDGNIDEMLVFKDIISDAESQSLCGGTY